MRIPKIKHLRRALTIIAGGLLAIGMGLACLRFSFAEPLTRLSYNLPFILRSNLDTDKVILVYLDEQSAKQLHQPIDDVWNRALHVPLLDRLTRDNARLVFYDIVFDQPVANTPDNVVPLCHRNSVLKIEIVCIEALGKRRRDAPVRAVIIELQLQIRGVGKRVFPHAHEIAAAQTNLTCRRLAGSAVVDIPLKRDNVGFRRVPLLAETELAGVPAIMSILSSGQH